MSAGNAPVRDSKRAPASEAQCRRGIRGAYSWRVLGAVVKALGGGAPVLKSKAARRFFAGMPVSERSRMELFLALGDLLVESGVSPAAFLVWRPDLAVALEHAAMRWDRQLATIQSRSAPVGGERSLVEQALRLAVVDLAVRAFAVLRLAGAAPPDSKTPRWAVSNGGGLFLRELASRASVTRAALAERLGVSKNAVDNWFDGVNRPNQTNLRMLARELAGAGDVARLEQDIGRCFALSALAEALAATLGWDCVTDLATACARFVRLIMEDVDRMNRRPLTETTSAAELLALMFGTAHSSTTVLLRNLARHETETGWHRDILAAGSPWGVQLQTAATDASGVDIVAGLAQGPDQVEGAESDGGISAAAEDEGIAAVRHAFRADTFRSDGQRGLKRDDLLRRITDVRAAAQKYPSSARVHFEVGGLMGLVAQWLASVELRNEAIFECKLAAELLPGWDAPLVEPAIILSNADMHEAALAELDSAEAKLPTATPHLRWVRGCVLMEVKRHGDALQEFERVLGAQPDYAVALSKAAECAFNVGKRKAGIKLAKRAFLLGEQQPYLDWWRKVHGPVAVD